MLYRKHGFLSIVLFAMTMPLLAQRKYVGADVCAPCHEQITQWIRGGVHEAAAVPAGRAKGQQGCETCHGPGSEHTENPSSSNIINFRTEDAALRSSACLGCHSASSPNLNFRRSDHNTARVACDQCHARGNSEGFHRMRAAKDTMSRAQPALCYGCHSEQRADFALPFRHPVERGFMECSSCHQPHGAFTLHQLRTRGTEPICGQCHEDKQGPFVFEHAASRATSCEACHLPHGSTNAKMLRRAQVRFQCLECHASTPAFHDLTQVRFQNCTVCHSRIHGSNLNRFFLE